METQESIKITLSAKDIEKILTDHAEKIMKEKGYQLAMMQNEEGPIPDVVFKGLKVD